MYPNENVKVQPIHLLYDERMLLHRPIGWVEPDIFPENLNECDDGYPCENPERLRVIYERLCSVEDRLVFEEDGLEIDQILFNPLRCQMATKQQICMAHTVEQYERLEQLQYYSNEELMQLTEEHSDMYYCHATFQAARLAAGGLLACVDAACDQKSTSNKALALVRPPGHHACQSKELGFCFIDSVVVAAKYAIQQKKATRVVILDWDIHDGNGTQEGTLQDENIFRIDLHRFNRKEGFFPFTGAPNDIGSGNARGLNLNMAWSHGGMGNTEYAAAFYELVLPLMAEYKPDMLLISCGLDAAKGDLLGGCELTPDFFHAMTRATLEVVGPTCPVVCALEGGYTMSILPDCMEAVTLAMINCPYQYHSSVEIGSYLGGAAIETKRNPWPANALGRSRRVLSKYYVRDGCSSIIDSAIHDINTCIRIFSNTRRWMHLEFHRIRGPPKPVQQPQPPKKRKLLESSFVCDRPFQRPRVFLWYGTELHHQKSMNLNYNVRSIPT